MAYLLVRHWSIQLASTPDSLVAIPLQQMAALDEAGLEALVDAVASERPSVATAATLTLHAHLDRWQRMPLHASSRRVGQLAGHLSGGSTSGRPGRGVRPGTCAGSSSGLVVIRPPITVYGSSIASGFCAASMVTDEGPQVRPRTAWG